MASGYPAFRLVFGSNKMGFHGREGQDEDLIFAQDSSVSGQFVQQWKLRMKPLKEVANSCDQKDFQLRRCQDRGLGPPVRGTQQEEPARVEETGAHLGY